MSLEKLLEPIGFELLKHEATVRMKIFKNDSSFLTVYYNHKPMRIEYHHIGGEVEVFKKSKDAKIRTRSYGVKPGVKDKCVELFNYIASFYKQELKEVPADFRL